MPSAPPEAEPAPADGALPPGAVGEIGSRPLSFYVHVPYCASRCGYCDFNTYTPTELADAPGSAQQAYVDAAVAEVRLARRVLGDVDLPVSTVFFGGGTPTLLPPESLARVLAAVGDEFGLAADAEVTTEANPESVDAAALGALRAAGFTRVSFGMQSAVPHVLATLDRVHEPERPQRAVEEARAAGFGHVSLDLIYGTPGERAVDWDASLEAVLATDVDHVSAYSLVVEDGTRMAAQVRRGALPLPDDDVAADRYLAAETALTAAGFESYEVSNWARPGGECRHNLAYWRGDHWWGIGAGAHSYVGGVRWWNVRHPSAYTDRVTGGGSPAQAREVLSGEDRRTEDVMLALRLRDGLALARVVGPDESGAVEQACAAFVADGLLDAGAWEAGRVRLTLQGRLLADHVVRTVLTA